jgi:hypothetical protein
MRDKRQVTVIVAGVEPSAHTTTVSRLRRAFRRRDERFKENFFYNLLNNGTVSDGAITYILKPLKNG